jgi:hypothetical protein
MPATYRAELRLRKVFSYARRLWLTTWRAGYLRLVFQIRIGRFYLCVAELSPHPLERTQGKNE